MSASYEKQIEELYRKVPSYQVVGSRAYKPGIETMTEFDLALGHPHADYPTVHIAGTNGKGSVSSMMAVALAAQGFKVALYTSPHLVDFRERIKIVHNGKYRMIPKAAVSKFLAKWNSFIEENNPSFFEITTAMAFDWFASQKVDYAVIETGLGGRLDSTNVITPKVSIITNIGLEHCMYLGNTLGEIAFEKAGIIKEGVPVVIGQSTPETLPVFQKVAAQKHSHLILSQNRDISDWKIEPGEMDLKGEYQIDNLKTVIAALQVLGIPQSEKVIYSLEHCASISGLHGR
ncbi:MAG: bifunctional folylpolyglutamate synthase/dihydrofolate synthase, partial [Bacteroidales bacterium]|nr:bifunctional folylpolyglutamate synthase/dihydrofolate synthase [Bacteroidales bacterium]